MNRLISAAFSVTVTAALAASSLCTGLSAFAESAQSKTLSDNMLTYEITDNRLRIISCEPSTVSIIVKDNIDGYDVTEIGEGAFEGCENLKEIELPDTITQIDEGAFSGCTSLEKVKFPSEMTEIPAKTFAMCDSLKELKLSDKITKIGEYALSYCNDLSWFSIPSSVTDIDANAFLCSNMGTVLNIPEGTKNISSLAFYNCTSIESVNLPSTLNSINSLAFLGCTNLKEINVDKGNSYYLSENGVLYSEKKRFLECYPAGITQESFTLPEEVRYISDGAFYANPHIKEVILPENLEMIGSAVFSNCTALEKMEIPSGITKIPDNLFCDCTSLWKVTIPESVTEIDAYAFLECRNLKSLDIPDSVTAFGDYAVGFYDEETDEKNEDGSQKLKFIPVEGFTINANYDTAAGDYARDNDIDINYLDGNKGLPKTIAFSVGGVIVLAGIVVLTVFLVLRAKKKAHAYYEN